MNHLLVFLLGMFVSFLIWLIVTEKVPLPIMLEIGLTSIALGLITCADAIATNEAYSQRGGGLVAAGLAIALYSVRRQYRKRARRQREGEPQVIDGNFKG